MNNKYFIKIIFRVNNLRCIFGKVVRLNRKKKVLC